MNMEAATATPAVQDKRFSRYRSVRKAATFEAEKPPVPVLPEYTLPPHAPQNQRPVTRAPSRYHRKTAVPRSGDVSTTVFKQNETTVSGSHARTAASRPQPVPEVRAAQETPLSKSLPATSQDSSSQTQRQPAEHTRIPAGSSVNKQRTTRYRNRAVSTPRDRPTSPRRSYDAAREEARAILDGEHDRLSRLKQQQEKLEKERRLQAEAKAASLRAEQANVPPAAESEPQKSLPQRARKWTIGGSSESSPPVTAPSSPPSAYPSQPVQSALSRKVSKIVRRPKQAEVIDESPPVPAPPPTGFVDQPVQRHRERRPTMTREASRTRTYEPKAGDGPPKTAIAAPQTVDAPVSAVNAGERRVEVRFEKSKITLPITPSTTVRELLNSASVIMSQPIDPRKSILIETYSPLGLERPLRRYERIRDIMNSWDSDTQNYLMIMPESECDAKGLDQKDAPLSAPSYTMLNLHHSQKPGKWERHWMILREDGQVTASKTENDGNATNVFHLSDFDVYMPKRREMKKLRPPKKICFAIKSQQRSIMFESTENFVHFFSTNDKAVADEWYNAAQAWRSWYLVNILDQGGASKPPPTSAAPIGVLPSPPRPSTSRSRDSIPYQLGTFQPLLEFSVDAFKYGEEVEQGPRPTEPTSSAGLQRSGTLVGRARNNSIPEGTTSVLQRTATTKKTRPSTSKASGPTMEDGGLEVKELRTAPILGSTDDGFTGKGLLARAFSIKKAQAEDNAALYENTDNAFTGKGLLARKMSTKKFVNENQVVAENTDDAFTGSGLLARKMSTKKFVNENLVVPENTNDAFTGKGLVSRSATKKRSQASRPGQPLVDLAATSEFVDRSLLRNVEAYEISQGQHLPVIDRSKNIEVNAKTGEV